MTDISPQHMLCMRDHFLIAMPGLGDSIFAQTVTYVCDHNEYGAMGVIINNPLDLNLGAVFDQLELKGSKHMRAQAVLAGGPVSREQGLVMHCDKGHWDTTMSFDKKFHLTASRDIVCALANGEAPREAQLALGYAGWSKGQLESELANNCWLTMPADLDIIFETPVEQRWSAVAERLGIDLSLLSQTAGHA